MGAVSLTTRKPEALHMYHSHDGSSHTIGFGFGRFDSSAAEIQIQTVSDVME